MVPGRRPHRDRRATLPGGGSRIINPDDGTFRDIDGQYPGLFNPCGLPSPDGTLLLCETFSEDGSQNGIHTIRSSDGGGLAQITSNPGGDDVPGDWSPNGKRIVFQRFDPNGDSQGLFVVNTNGTGLKQITPPDFDTERVRQLVAAGKRDRLLPSRDARRAQLDLGRPRRRHRPARDQRPAGIGLRRRERRSQRPRLQPSSVVARRDEDRVRQVHSNDVDGEIYTVNLDGTGLTQVTHAPGANTPTGARTRRPDRRVAGASLGSGRFGDGPPAPVLVDRVVTLW